eukprot:g11156.t1
MQSDGRCRGGRRQCSSTAAITMLDLKGQRYAGHASGIRKAQNEDQGGVAMLTAYFSDWGASITPIRKLIPRRRPNTRQLPRICDSLRVFSEVDTVNHSDREGWNLSNTRADVARSCWANEPDGEKMNASRPNRRGRSRSVGGPGPGAVLLMGRRWPIRRTLLKVPAEYFHTLELDRWAVGAALWAAAQGAGTAPAGGEEFAAGEGSSSEETGTEETTQRAPTGQGWKARTKQVAKDTEEREAGAAH